MANLQSFLHCTRNGDQRKVERMPFVCDQGSHCESGKARLSYNSSELNSESPETGLLF